MYKGVIFSYKEFIEFPISPARKAQDNDRTYATMRPQCDYRA